MSQPWEIYDALLDGLPGDVVVRASGQGPRWTRVLNSAGGVGTAWTMDVRSRPALADGSLDGRPLRDVLSCTGWGGLCFRVGFFVGILGVGWSFRGTKAAVGSGG